LLSSEFPFRFFFTLLSFIWGACVGSYLNVCIYRIPKRLSTVAPRSFCPKCGTTIPWYYNIPLVSFLGLGGKCAYCRSAISARYFTVELITAWLFLLAWFKFDLTMGPRLLGLVPVTELMLVPIYWLMIGGLMLGTFVDFEHMIIPDRVTLGGIAAGLLISLAVPALQSQTSHLQGLLSSVVGAATGWGILWSVGALGTYVLKKDAMGFGDVKLMGAIGAFFGWHAVLFTLMAASLFGTLVSIVLVAMGRREMKGRIPFGPYIALAALVWMYWGPTLWRLYLNLLIPPDLSLPL
jgi:leader peptidase (prepilin peptidase)/N-methyltransferase